MTILKVLLTSIFSVVLLFILTKLMGNRQMSQLTMFEYVNGITIGSIAAELAIADADGFIQPLVAMVVYAGMVILAAFITSHSIVARRMITGESKILYNNGKLFRNRFKRARLDLDEFLTLARNAGYFDLSEIQTAVLEPNGKISFLPKAEKRPATPEDLRLSVNPAAPVAVVIMDRKILHRNLKAIGLNEVWLSKQLDAQGISSVSDVFLALCDNQNNLSVYKNEYKKETGDIFE